MSKGVSYKKFTDNIPNEDSYKIGDNYIFLSDGAGGCGLFANEWSRYLVEHLDEKNPISSFKELDNWIEEIWEPFYDEHEQKSKEYDGIFQSKFYAEGSCATLAAVWKIEENKYKWISYGDSVVFHYNEKSNILEHSFTKLVDFSNPPYLISCKDPIFEEGFNSGEFTTEESSTVFACSDALSHYIIMMYMLSDFDKNKSEIDKILATQSKDAQMLSLAMSLDNYNFFDNVIKKLEKLSSSEIEFGKYLKCLYKHGLIDIDDFTLTIIKFNTSKCNIH